MVVTSLWALPTIVGSGLIALANYRWAPRYREHTPSAASAQTLIP